jgi:hypothetical protein
MDSHFLKRSWIQVFLRGAFTMILLIALAGLPLSPTKAVLTVLFVRADGSPLSNCLTSWANACTLGKALSIAVSGDELWVKAGIYAPTSGIDRDQTFQLKSGVEVYGGFAGNETGRGQRNWELNVTTLSGEIGNLGRMDDNTYHVVTGSGTNSRAVLDGFTITHGSAVREGGVA